MKVTIEYCGEWNYEPRAVSLADKFTSKFSAEAELFRSSGGVFEVTVDGKLVYSKKATGEFPDEEQLLVAIENS